MDLDPAFSYEGLRLRTAKKVAGAEQEDVSERRVQAPNQFAAEMDHMAGCILEDQPPHTPGEEGMQDLKLMTALYDAMTNGKTVRLAPVEKQDAFRGPPPAR